jgi:signal transduction histidine kinase
MLADTNLHFLAGNLQTWPTTAPVAAGWTDFTLPALPGAEDPEAVHIRAKTATLPNGLHLLAGQDMDDVDDVKEIHRHYLGWGLALTLGLGLVAGIAMSLRMVRRVEAINRTSRQIMLGDFLQRVPVQGTGDEFDELARHLNAMLEHIQKLMMAVKGVSDNIAHDLRTPLGRLKTRLELAKINPPSPEEYERWIDDTTAKLDAVLDTFEALLKIAEVESKTARQTLTAVDLRRIVKDVAELYEPVSEEKGQWFEVRTEPVRPIMGDRDLLFRAFANLLDNAIKFTPAGGYLEVCLKSTAAGSQVVIADDGPGIREDAREKVFLRFFRLEASRATPGNGLGLSLVAAVAELHGASIRLEDNQPGLRVIMDFYADDRSIGRTRAEMSIAAAKA